MNQDFEALLAVIAKRNIAYADFVAATKQIDEYSELFDVRDVQMWRALGLDITRTAKNQIELKTRRNEIKDQIFCVVDIETSGGINSGQIIEIGALKLQNGEIIGKFETFVYAPYVPENISELTGITAEHLKNAPSLAFVIEQFKVFLGQSVFVAHNVRFDYGFISATLEALGYGELLNRKLCTIDLARRTITSPKYGLGTLKELLGIDNTHHRALSDAIAAAEIFKHSLQKLPSEVKTTEDLIEFSKSAKTMKRLKITTNEAGESVKFDDAVQADKFEDNKNLSAANDAQNLNIGSKTRKAKEPKLPIFEE